MYYIGMDIGTTTISGLLIDGMDGHEIARKTIKNTAHIQTDAPWKSLQSPDRILDICLSLIEEFLRNRKHLVRGIGITGQMHGIVYIDREGRACSDLISWQDERGNLFFDDTQTYCQRIRELTGCSVATGLGISTLFYDTANHLVPDRAVSVCTITDYVAMRLTNRKAPLMHVSNAASLGLFSNEAMAFETEKIAALGIDLRLLPKVTAEERIIGTTKSGLTVAVPIGDNQASFLGSVGQGADTLINIGTGSQISRLSDVCYEREGLECRPYVDRKFLLVGASLCGGQSYNLLKDLFTDVIKTFVGVEVPDLVKLMDQAAEKAWLQHMVPLEVDTRFRGTRDDSEIRGSIRNIDCGNLTLGNLCCSFLRGICEELYGFYEKVKAKEPPAFYAISGNAARNSEILRQLVREVFGADVRVPQNAEEAAYGAALLAIHTVEGRAWPSLRSLIRYEPICLSKFAVAN